MEGRDDAPQRCEGCLTRGRQRLHAVKIMGLPEIAQINKACRQSRKPGVNHGQAHAEATGLAAEQQDDELALLTLLLVVSVSLLVSASRAPELRLLAKRLLP